MSSQEKITRRRFIKRVAEAGLGTACGVAAYKSIGLIGYAERQATAQREQNRIIHQIPENREYSMWSSVISEYIRVPEVDDAGENTGEYFYKRTGETYIFENRDAPDNIQDYITDEIGIGIEETTIAFMGGLGALGLGVVGAGLLFDAAYRGTTTIESEEEMF